MSKTPYQRRMTLFVVGGSVYAVAFPVMVSWLDASPHWYLLYVSTLALLYCLAVGFDAVYDSLLEHQRRANGE